jgi:hypothetical protein
MSYLKLERTVLQYLLLAVPHDQALSAKHSDFDREGIMSS